jgi:ketosteroid isomerase-like protein
MKLAEMLTSWLLLGALAGCARGADQDADADRAELRAAAVAFDQALSQRDLDAVVSFISDETVMLPDGGAQVSGLDNISSIMDRAINRRGFRSEADPPRIGVSTRGGYGYSLTNVTRTYERSDGTLSVEHYRDFHVWERRADGSWKIAIDIWNALPEGGRAAD